MPEVRNRKLGRPPLPVELRKRHIVLSINIREEEGLRLRAEAESRGKTYSGFLKTLVDIGLASLAAQEAA
jgi:hypothetical protein